MLDLITQGQIWDFVLKELKRREMGMIAVSHSPELLEKVCDRVVRYPQADLAGDIYSPYVGNELTSFMRFRKMGT